MQRVVFVVMMSALTSYSQDSDMPFQALYKHARGVGVFHCEGILEKHWTREDVPAGWFSDAKGEHFRFHSPSPPAFVNIEQVPVE